MGLRVYTSVQREEGSEGERKGVREGGSEGVREGGRE